MPGDAQRDVCWRCRRPLPLCVCTLFEGRGPVANRTEIVILQHPRERAHALGTARIDVAELAISHLEQSLNEIQRGLTGTDELLPVGVTDLRSLYFLLDLRPPIGESKQYNVTMLTSTREKMSVMTVRLQSIFHATWSQVFGLSIAHLSQRLRDSRGRLNLGSEVEDLEAVREYVLQPHQLAFNTD